MDSGFFSNYECHLDDECHFHYSGRMWVFQLGCARVKQYVIVGE